MVVKQELRCKQFLCKSRAEPSKKHYIIEHMH